jgi:hypothetical protein
MVGIERTADMIGRVALVDSVEIDAKATSRRQIELPGINPT